MRKLLQHLGDGRTTLVEAPAPGPAAGSLLILTSRSLISAGTERMLVNFGRAGWLGKMRQQPERVRAVLQKIRAEGLVPTWAAVRAKLDQPIPLGYCQVGTVIAAAEVDGFQAGERVVSNGSHAEVVSVLEALCARIPDGVSDDAATFTPLAAVAWQGISLIELRPGDKVVVMGLGLIGQLAVRILVGMGCEVLGLDPSAERCARAERFGARLVPPGSDPVSAALAWTQGIGARGVLITASSSSNMLVSQAARSCGIRGKIVLVGVVGLLLNRADFYSREIMFQVSCSYGSRDPQSPYSVQTNFRRILAWMSEGKLPVADLITHRQPFESAPEAYQALEDPRSLGIMLEYGRTTEAAVLSRSLALPAAPVPAGGLKIGLLGAGNFASRTLLPAIVGQAVRPGIAAIVSAGGVSAVQAAARFGAAMATTDAASVLADPTIDAVFISTRHDAHAKETIAALRAGKHVWVEKPLALSMADVEAVIATARGSGRILMLGFNRRFSPLSVRIRQSVAGRPGPYRIEMTINAGRLEPGHWVLDPRLGGGRIVGEVCHFIDLARFLTGSRIAAARCLRRDSDGQDGACFELEMGDGSSSRIDYRTDLPAHIPKEHITLSGAGFSTEIRNWNSVAATGMRGVAQGRRWLSTPRKGHTEAVRAFLHSASSGSAAPIPLDEIREASLWAVRLQGMSRDEHATIDETQSCKT